MSLRIYLLGITESLQKHTEQTPKGATKKFLFIITHIWVELFVQYFFTLFIFPIIFLIVFSYCFFSVGFGLKVQGGALSRALDVSRGLHLDELGVILDMDHSDFYLF